MLQQDLEHDTGILTLTLARPPVNALNQALYDSIHEGLAFAAHNQDVRAIVLAASGTKAFSAGADTKAFADLPLHEAEQRQLALILRCLQDWVQCSKPTVAALEAPAIGAGLMLACACDEIVMSQDAWVSLPEIQLNLPTPIGAAIVQRRVRHSAVHALLQRAERFDADRCRDQGLADEVVSGREVARVARERACVLAAFDTDVYAVNKRWMNQGLSQTLESAAKWVDQS